MVSIDPRTITVLVGTPPVVFTCTITLNHAIGPDHSALCVDWSSVKSSATPKMGVYSVFHSTMTISSSTRKEYCCNARIVGTNAVSTCTSIEVLGEKVTVCSCNELLFATVVTEIGITGQYQQIQLGSTSAVTCSVPQLVNSNIKWISHNGAVVSSSGALMLFGNHSINERIFRCVVNSSQLHSSGERNITVTVKSKF